MTFSLLYFEPCIRLHACVSTRALILTLTTLQGSTMKLCRWYQFSCNIYLIHTKHLYVVMSTNIHSILSNNSIMCGMTTMLKFGDIIMVKKYAIWIEVKSLNFNQKTQTYHFNFLWCLSFPSFICWWYCAEIGEHAMDNPPSWNGFDTFAR